MPRVHRERFESLRQRVRFVFGFDVNVLWGSVRVYVDELRERLLLRFGPRLSFVQR